jgi:class 3 adenylate cyclase/tetratricopeptide (TPR) repeat protein
MQCSRCQHDNPAGQKFCGECGARLASRCPSCSASNPPGQKFCGECGTALGQVDVPGRYGTPESYTPKHLAEKILTSKAALEGERKQVTVLFADLKGSMELLADRDPEDARKILDPVLERMMEAVHRYEGTVNQVMGDGIMALFGAPLAHEDHAVRACYAALRMQESVVRYAEEVFRVQGVRVQIRVGLNSGEVVVRTIGSDLRMDYTAVGQTTHLAARMEQMAAPGTIMLTPATLRLAEDNVQVAPLGPVMVKGLPDPIDAHVLTGARTRTRLQAAVARGLTKFVGRDPEIEQIHRALDLARQGHGQLVAVVGEPGVGKSRLFHEFICSVGNQGWLILEAGSVSYGKATSYLPVINLLKTYCQIETQDDARNIREKVTSKILALDRALEPILPAVLALLNVPVDDAQWEALDPPERRQRTVEACKRLFLRESQAQPLVLVFEDLHWIDSETQSFLDLFVEALPSAPILLLCNCRPEYRHAWKGKSYYSETQLDALAPERAEALLRYLLGADPGLQPLVSLLIERTAGNPFFLEETVRMLIETKVVEGEPGSYRAARRQDRLEVPATVQAVLASRIDRLEFDDKRLLQVASVVGKDVPLAVLRGVSGHPTADIDRSLQLLQGAEFLYESGPLQERELHFKHALTHEVAYGELLIEQRRLLHAKAVEVMEGLFTDRLLEHAEALARHAVLGEVWDKAVDYLREAGTKAWTRGAVDESLERYDNALEVSRSLHQSPDNCRRSIDVRLDFHAPLFIVGQIPRLQELHQEAELLARQINDENRIARACTRLGVYSWAGARYREAVKYAEQALSVATTDPELRVLATHTLAINHFHLAEYRLAIRLFQKNAQDFEAEAVKRYQGEFTSPYIMACSYLAWSFAALGEFQPALAYGDRGVEAAAAAGHPAGQAFAVNFAAIARFYKGDHEAAIRLCEHAVHLSEKHGLLFFLPIAYTTWGRVLARAGRAPDSIEYLQRAKDMWETMGLKVALCRFHLNLAEGLFRAGNLTRARPVADHALDLAVGASERGDEAEALWVIGEVAAASDRTVESARPYYNRAKEVAETLGRRPLVADCHLGLGKLYSRTDQRDQAREHLAIATTMYRDMGMTYWLEQAEAEMREFA